MMTTHEGIDDMDDQATVCIGQSIEVRRKRIASGTIPNRVKFTMQPYHQKVCSNANIQNDGIVVHKPELPHLLGDMSSHEAIEMFRKS